MFVDCLFAPVFAFFRRQSQVEGIGTEDFQFHAAVRADHDLALLHEILSSDEILSPDD